MLLEPNNYELELVYCCPKCDSNIWVSLYEAKNKGFQISCCNTVYKLKQINEVELNYKFVSEKNIAETHNNLISQAIKVLRKNDFSKKESIRLVEIASKKNPETLADLIRFAISEG